MTDSCTKSCFMVIEKPDKISNSITSKLLVNPILKAQNYQLLIVNYQL